MISKAKLQKMRYWFHFHKYRWGWDFWLTSWPLRRLVLVYSRVDKVMFVSTDGTPPDSGNYPKWGFYIWRKKRKIADRVNHA